MSKTVVIHQPDFLPHLAFFHRLLHANLFVILDTAQFVTGTSRSWMHRDQIKTSSGKTWLSLSVQKTPRGTAINEILLSDKVDWRTANLNLVKQHYSHAPYFEEFWPELDKLYALRTNSMAEFNMASIKMLMDALGIDIDIVLASELNAGGKSNERLVNILQEVGASHYLSGVGARDYFEEAPYAQAGIEVLWQEFEHPVYDQLYGDFIPYLTSIDAIFNCGVEQTRELLRTC